MTKVLVVDDEFDLLESITAILEDEGIEVYKASDGLEALQVLETERPDVILSDVMMPKLSGKELALRVKESSKFKQIPVILMSSAPLGKTQAGPDVKWDHFLPKPFDIDALLATIDTAIQLPKEAQ